MGTANRRIVAQAVGTVAFGSVGAGYSTLNGPIAGRGVIICIANSLNAGCIISLDGGTTDFIRLPAATPLTLDLSASNVEYSGTISVKQDGGGAPGSGFISCGVIRAN